MIVEHLVLQIFLAILPCVAFLFGYHEGEKTLITKAWIWTFCAVSVVLMMVFSHSFALYVFDFRLIPLMIGFYYAGALAGTSLLAVYLAARYAFVESGSDFVSFAILHIIFIPLMVIALRRFQLEGASGRLRIVTSLMVLSSVVIALSIAVYLLDGGRLEETLYIGFAVNMVGYIVVGRAVLYFIETIREKHKNRHTLEILLQERSAATDYLTNVLDMLPSTVMSINTEGTITSVNEAVYVEYPQLRGKQLVGLHLSEFTDLFGVDHRATGLYKALSGVVTKNEIVEYADFRLLVNALPLRHPLTGACIGALSVNQNLTELLELRSKLRDYERLGLIGQMAASVAHEIRNPMTSIRGFIQLMRETPDKPPKEGYYTIVLDELDRVNSIIEDLLTLARDRVIHKEWCDLNHLVGDLQPLLWADANMRGIGIEVVTNRISPVYIDPREIKQMLLNLTRNGMEAMSQGGTLLVRTYEQEDQVAIEVTDTGVGMTPEAVDRLFQPFYTTKEQGTGLGLTACFNIAERHGAKIMVKSTPGQGTTFTVLFSSGRIDTMN